MSDWIDILLKESFKEDIVPSKDISWERFDALMRRKNKQRRLAWWTAALGTVAAAGIALVFYSPTGESSVSVESPVNATGFLSSATSVELTDDIDEVISAPYNALLINRETRSMDPQYQIITAEEVKSGDIMWEDNQVRDTVENKREAESRYISYDEFWQESSHQGKLKVRISPFIKGLIAKDAETDNLGISIKLFNQISKNYPSVFGAWGQPSSTHTIHSIPLSLGMDLCFSTGDRFNVTTGVDLSYYHSLFSNDLMKSEIQNAYYLGIPLRLDWTAWQRGPVSAWLGAGGKVDRLVYGKFGQAKIHDNTFNWSLTGSAGVQYELFPKVGLFLSPEVSYYFKPSNPVIQTYRTENPLMITIGAGLRINL